MADAVLFVGPSGHGVDAAAYQAAGVRCVPPVRRGDVARIVARRRRPGVMIVCDGAFQHVPAVSHAELCAALDAGWRLWGVSSIGAIRAWELRDEGMRGHGWVYAQFARHADFTDDELCLTHFPQPPYFPVSEALVNLRHALALHGAALGIDDAAQAATIARLRGLWFGDRTIGRLHEALVDDGGCSAAVADALLSAMARQRVKTLDLLDLLRERPWRA